MSGLHYDITASNDDLIAKLRQSREAIVNGSKDAEGAGSAMEGMFKKAAVALGMVGTVDFAKNIISQVVSITGEFQQLEVAFSTMLGSEEAANTLMQQLVKTAATTPFDLKGVSQGAKQLIAYGIEAKDVNKTIVELGNIAAGLSIPLNDLVYLYGTTMVQGRMFTMDLRQFQGRGIPIADALAKQFGVASDKIGSLVTAGKVTSKEFKAAIESMSADGGKFANLMDKQSQTIVGKISNIGDAIDMAMNKFGESNNGIINGVLDGTSGIVNNYQEIGTVLIELVATYGTYKAVLIIATAMQKLYNLVMTEAAVQMQLAAASGITLSEAESVAAARSVLLSGAMKSVTASMAVNPITAAAVAISALALVIYKCATYEDEFGKANERLQDATDNVSKEVEKEKFKLDALNDQLQASKKGTNAWKAAKDAVIKQYGQYDNKLANEINRTGDLTLSYDKLTIAIRKSIAARGLKKFYDTSSDAAQGDIQQQRDSIYNYLIGKKGRAFANKSMNVINSAMSSGKGISAISDSFLKSIGLSPIWNTYKNKKYRTILPGKGNGAGDDQEFIKSLNSGALTSKAWSQSLSDYSSMNNLSKDDMNEILYGIKPAAKAGNNVNERKDKEYYETLKKNLQGDLDALPKIKANIGKRNKLIKEINKVQANIDWYSPSKSNQAAKNAKTEAAKEETALEKRNESIAKQLDLSQKAKDSSKKIKEDNIDSTFDIRQKTIEAMPDSLNKQLHQIQLGYDKLVEENKRRKISWIKELQDTANEEFEARNPDWRKKNPHGRPVVTEGNLSDEQRMLLGQYDVAADVYKNSETDKLYKSLNDKYRNFDVKRADVNKQYEDDRSNLGKEYNSGKSDMSLDDYNSRIEESKRLQAEAIKQIGDEEYNALQKDGGAIAELFDDTSNKSVKEIQSIIDKIQVLLQWIKGVKDSNGDSTITHKDGSKSVVTAKQLGDAGFTPSQANVIGQDPTKLKNVSTQITKLKDEVNKENPFKALSSAIKDFSNNEDKAGSKGATFEGKMKKLGSAAADVADMFSNLTGQLSKMFSEAGNTQMADLTQGVGDVMSSVSNIGKGFAQGGLVGGIASAAGEAISWAGKAFAAESRHKEALKKIQQDIISQQRAYNLELMKTNLEYKKGTTIFGTDNYSKAINAVSVMKDAYSALNNELKNINDIEIITGHKKTGLFGWGQGKDVYSDVLSVYPQLIKANGEFDETLAKTILDTRRMSDEDKAALQTMINYADEAEDAWSKVQDYFTDIFGELGTTLSSTLKNAFVNGQNYAYEFGDSVSDMLENLASQMVYSLYFGDIFKKANDELLKITKDNSIGTQEQFQDYTKIMSSLMASVSANVPAAETLMQQWKELAAKYGFDIFDNTKSSSKSSNTATAVTATQDSVDVLNGRMSAMVLIEEQQRDYIQMVYNTLLLMNAANGNNLAKMEEIRGLVYLSTSYLEDIKKSAAYLPGISERLDQVIENTNSLTSR